MSDASLDLPAPRAMLLRHKLTVGVVLLVLATGGLAAPWFMHWRQSRAPFPASALNLRLSLSAVPVSGLQPAITKLGVTPEHLRAMQPVAPGQQAIVGELQFTVPKRIPAGSRLVLFAIDQRSHRLVQWIWGWGSGPHAPTSGFDGHFGEFATRYSWLAPAGLTPLDNGTTQGAMAITLPFDARSPLVFYAALNPDANPIANLNKDVLITLGFLGPQGQAYWAQRLGVIGPAR